MDKTSGAVQGASSQSQSADITQSFGYGTTLTLWARNNPFVLERQRRMRECFDEIQGPAQQPHLNPQTGSTDHSMSSSPSQGGPNPVLSPMPPGQLPNTPGSQNVTNAPLHDNVNPALLQSNFQSPLSYVNNGNAYGHQGHEWYPMPENAHNNHENPYFNNANSGYDGTAHPTLLHRHNQYQQNTGIPNGWDPNEHAGDYRNSVQDSSQPWQWLDQNQAHFKEHFEDHLLERGLPQRVDDIPGPLRPTRQGKYKLMNPPRQGPVQSKQCIENGCKRRFRPNDTTKMDLCRRHQEKYDRNNAEPPTFKFHPDMWNFPNAKSLVYPAQKTVAVDGDDVIYRDANHVGLWVTRFVEAANQPYTGGSQYDDFHTRQQKVYNGKVCKTQGYGAEEVNARMRLLYEAALRLHTGGEAVYPTGGDNDGYGNPDLKLIFSARLKEITRILKTDKRVCMDVIEGRGVTAFVANPTRFEKRKTQNKDSNARKQKKQQLGDRLQAKRKAKGQDVDGSDIDSDHSLEEVDGEDDYDRQTSVAMPTPASLSRPIDEDEDYVPTPEPHQLAGTKRKRQTRSSTAPAPKPTRARAIGATKEAFAQAYTGCAPEQASTVDQRIPESIGTSLQAPAEAAPYFNGLEHLEGQLQPTDVRRESDSEFHGALHGRLSPFDDLFDEDPNWPASMN